MEPYEQLHQLVLNGKLKEIVPVVRQALARGNQADDILVRGLLPPMDVVGQRMKSGEMFIPEVLRAAKTVQEALNLLKPLLTSDNAAGKGTVLIGTVEGDLHDIGKNLVGMLLEGAGFRVVDLGVGVSPAVFVEAARSHRPRIIGLSALLTTTMPKMAETVLALEAGGLRDSVKVMAGGAPVSQKFVDEIHADGYGSDAAAAVDLAKSWVES